MLSSNQKGTKGVQVRSGRKYQKTGNQVTYISDFEKNLKDTLKPSVQFGCDTFPNELMRSNFKAKPIWNKIQKHSKNAAIC